MTKTPKLALSILLLAIPASAQQVASIDLTQPPPQTDRPGSNGEKDKDSGRCKNGGVGFADGYTLLEDKEPRQVRLAIVDLSSSNLVIGGHVQATVEMRNIGTKTIRIPWSTDWWTTKAGQNPDNRSWQVGEFRVHLGENQKNDVELVGSSQILYSAASVAGSTLTLKPGEAIAARIKFAVTTAHPAHEQIGEARDTVLWVEWFQTTRSRRVEDCGVTLGYFPYIYDQTNPSVPVKIEKPLPKWGASTHDANTFDQ